MDRRFLLTTALAAIFVFTATWMALGGGIPSGVRYYPNCRTAWAAGAAPIRRGEPGYRSALDGDGDGIACEPWKRR